MVETRNAPKPTELVQAWVDAPENTARSVLVTIFGDTILPVGPSIWLGQLFQLTDVFGFSRRLVRTSLYRLAAEGWCTSERVGRQSKYSLTTIAVEESERAADRIYQSPHPDWTGQWTVAFLDTPGLTSAVRRELEKHLRWHGFISLTSGTLASPSASLASAREICALIEPNARVPLAVLEFSDLEDLVADGFFAEALSVGSTGRAYDDFLQSYGHVVAEVANHGPEDAFALRTVLIHDLRRVRLRAPDMPAALLPSGWPGTEAHRLASQLYPQLSTASQPWLSEVLGCDYPHKVARRIS